MASFNDAPIPSDKATYYEYHSFCNQHGIRPTIICSGDVYHVPQWFLNIKNAYPSGSQSTFYFAPHPPTYF